MRKKALGTALPPCFDFQPAVVGTMQGTLRGSAVEDLRFVLTSYPHSNRLLDLFLRLDHRPSLPRRLTRVPGIAAGRLCRFGEPVAFRANARKGHVKSADDRASASEWNTREILAIIC